MLTVCTKIDFQSCFHLFFKDRTRSLKITEKVSCNIASEASYVYILSGQKSIKKCQKWSILASISKPEACGQIVLPDRSVLIGQKLVENSKTKKFKCDILSNFQTLWLHFRFVKTCSICSSKMKEGV